jgi:hypothetical protein
MSRSRLTAAAIDLLDQAMRGVSGQALNFIEVGAHEGSLADPSSEFGHLAARALDRAMSAAEWAARTSLASQIRRPSVPYLLPTQAAQMPVTSTESSSTTG